MSLSEYSDVCHTLVNEIHMRANCMYKSCLLFRLCVQVFEVNFQRLSIEPSESCAGDRVQLFDGDSYTSLSEPLCGQDPPSETFTSHSSILVVRFQSDQGGADAGFVLGYAVVEGETGQNGVDHIPAASGQRNGSL